MKKILIVLMISLMSFASYAFDGQENAPDNQINLIENTTSMSEDVYAPTLKFRLHHRHVVFYDENGNITYEYDEYWIEVIW